MTTISTAECIEQLDGYIAASVVDEYPPSVKQHEIWLSIRAKLLAADEMAKALEAQKPKYESREQWLKETALTAYREAGDK